MSEQKELQRIANALERIADILENKKSQGIVLKLDGKTIAQEVIAQTLRRAALGSSSLVGKLNTERDDRN